MRAAAVADRRVGDDGKRRSKGERERITRVYARRRMIPLHPGPFLPPGHGTRMPRRNAARI